MADEASAKKSSRRGVKGWTDPNAGGGPLELSALPGDRLASADAYRGFVMFLMTAEVLRLGPIAAKLPDSATWKFLAFHQSHVEWVGCSLHDLIQPSFSFLVGLALPFSIASRRRRGQAVWWMALHALWRSIVLVLLGVWLRSVYASQTNWTFEDTLSQIGLGYLALFLLGLTPRGVQIAGFVLLLVGYWAAFAWHPLPGGDFDYEKVFVSPDWAAAHNQTGFAAHWNKNSNLAWKFDTWFLNLFRRESEWVANKGGYSTLSFIPTLATMVLGLLAGGVAREPREGWRKLLVFVVAGVAGLGLGWAANSFGICPNVKRIWTPSWVLFSGGWCLLILALFYLVMDLAKLRAWAFPLTVIGMNSIAAYCLAHGFDGYLSRNLTTHLGSKWDASAATWLLQFFPSAQGAGEAGGVEGAAVAGEAVSTAAELGAIYAPLVSGSVLLLMLWLILYWMYRRRVFVRV
jgi:heparan-alpha-glucosaminide N-acetyltransferase